MREGRQSYHLSIFKLRLFQGLTYRTAALAGVATQFFWGLIFIMVYLAFYGEAASVAGFTKEHLVSYIWLQQAFLVFIALWIRDNELFGLIQTGNIAYELIRRSIFIAFGTRSSFPPGWPVQPCGVYRLSPSRYSCLHLMA